jgi:hypothetical protein
VGPRDRPHLTPPRLPPPFAANPHSVTKRRVPLVDAASSHRMTGYRPASHATFPHLHLYTVRPYRAVSQAAADPRVSGALVHRGGRGAAERPVAHPARRVRGNPPAVSILVRGPVTADRRPVTPATTASRQKPGGQREPHPASPQPAPLRLRSAGGRVGRRPIPQGRAAPFRRPAQSERLPRVWGRVLSSGQCPRRLLR